MTKAYVCRQTITNLNGKIIGYELLFRGDDGFTKTINSNLMATSKVLLNLLTHMSFSEVIGNEKKAFVNMDDKVIFSGILGLLSPKHFVIELLEDTEPSDNLIQYIIKYKKQGFEFALDDFDCKEQTFTKYAPLFGHLTYVKVCLKDSQKSNVKKMLQYFKSVGIKSVAEKIETSDEYKECIEDGFDLFQGFHLKKPELIEVEVPAETSKSAILHIISMIKEDKEIDDIENFVKNQPDLVYNLLKYINSPSVSLKHHVGSIKQAMNLIGRDRLTRWLLLYIYSESGGDSFSLELLNTALNRAKMMEDAARSASEREKAYIAGLFSLLDVVFDTPMHIVIRGVPLEKEIVSAIIERGGVLGQMLLRIETEEKKKLQELVNENFSALHTGEIIKLLKNSGVQIV